MKGDYICNLAESGKCEYQDCDHAKAHYLDDTCLLPCNGPCNGPLPAFTDCIPVKETEGDDEM